MDTNMIDSTDDSFDILKEMLSFGNEPKGKGVRIPLKVFLKSYVDIAHKGGNSVDVANELGISPQAVRQRVSKLLCQGIKLPKLGNICRNVTGTS
jgi:hypothetical protein